MKEFVSLTRLVIITGAVLAAVAIGWQFLPHGELQASTAPMRLERSTEIGWEGVSSVQFENRTGRPVRLVGVQAC